MRKAIYINPIVDSDNKKEWLEPHTLDELNKYLSEGWQVEKEIVLPSSTSVSNNVTAYKSLASVILIMIKNN